MCFRLGSLKKDLSHGFWGQCFTEGVENKGVGWLGGFFTLKALYTVKPITAGFLINSGCNDIISV